MNRALLSLTLFGLPLSPCVGSAYAENPFEDNFTPIQMSQGQAEKAAGVNVPTNNPAAAPAAPAGGGGGAGPAISQKAITPPAAPAKADDKKKDDKQQPQMPQLPGLPSGKKPDAGQGGSGGSSAAGSKLDEAARQMIASGDKKKMALGVRVGQLGKSQKEALALVDKADAAMRSAKADLQAADEALTRFAGEQENGKDVKNIKEVAKDELESGKQALDCPKKEPPAPVPPIAGDPARKSKYPPEADSKIADAEKLLQSAKEDAASARKIADAMKTAGEGIVQTDTQLRSHLTGGTNLQFAQTINEAVAEVEQKTAKAEARLKELKLALDDSKKSKTAAHDADTKTEDASAKTVAAKTVITVQNQNLDTAAVTYMPLALPPPLGPGLRGKYNLGCQQAQTANQAIVTAVNDAQTAVPPAEKAVQPAVDAAKTAKEALGKVGEI